MNRPRRQRATHAAACPFVDGRLHVGRRHVFNYAVSNDWLLRSPCRGVKLPKAAPAKRYALDADAAIVDEMTPEDAAIVLLTVLTGLRWSEVTGLTVGHRSERTPRASQGRLAPPPSPAHHSPLPKGTEMVPSPAFFQQLVATPMQSVEVTRLVTSSSPRPVVLPTNHRGVVASLLSVRARHATTSTYPVAHRQSIQRRPICVCGGRPSADSCGEGLRDCNCIPRPLQRRWRAVATGWGRRARRAPEPPAPPLAV